jgi:hypothetical protein
MLDLLLPTGDPTTVDIVLADVGVVPTDGPLTVGDPRIAEYLAAVARRLLEPSLVRRHPELGSLGFFLRRSRTDDVLAGLHHGASSPVISLRVPRGLIVHIPPANVDTLFVYSWALAALAGNRNIVRISPRAGSTARTLVTVLNEELADAHPAVAQTQRLISYGRDEAATAALSAACDLRVMWGGDEAVQAVRGHRLGPTARDLTFPDRSSFAAVSVAGWAAASTGWRRETAAALAADAYWFDQAACASPRTVFVVGSAGPASMVRDQLLDLVAAAVAERGWGRDPAMAVQRRVSAYGLAADGVATRVHAHGPSVLGVDLAPGATPPRAWLGAGLFPVAVVASLDDLAPLLRRRDQTLTHAGFDQTELLTFVAALGARGLDRIVPIGSALTFAALWDGYDLLREFTRTLTLRL